MKPDGTTDLVVHPQTERHVAAYLQNPSHGLLLCGPAGSGKGSLAAIIVGALLAGPASKVTESPYCRVIGPDNGSISIETVRQLNHFLALKVPGNSQSGYRRAVIIDQANTLTLEAQNALLKTLEEPPDGSLLIMTATSLQSLLPTVVSRLQVMHVLPPTSDQLMKFFTAHGNNEAEVKRALVMAGQLPGLMAALFANQDHPLLTAAAKARELLQGTAYDRLLHVDELSKQRESAQQTVFMIGQMAHISLQSSSGQVAERWQKIMQVVYQTAEALDANAQPKLALTSLMLTL